MSLGVRRSQEILNASHLLGIKEGINKNKICDQRRLPKPGKISTVYPRLSPRAKLQKEIFCWRLIRGLFQSLKFSEVSCKIYK